MKERPTAMKKSASYTAGFRKTAELLGFNADALEKQAQSIVFGGGPPSGGAYGSPYELPRQNPLRTMGQLGDALKEGTRTMGRIGGKYVGWNPTLCENLADIGSYLIPTYGPARATGDTLSAIQRGDDVQAMWNVASTPSLIKPLIPRILGLGLAAFGAGPKAYKRLKPVVRQLLARRVGGFSPASTGLSTANRAVPAVSPIAKPVLPKINVPSAQGGFSPISTGLPFMSNAAMPL